VGDGCQGTNVKKINGKLVMKEYKLTLKGEKYEVKVKELQQDHVVVEVNGNEYVVGVESKSPVSVQPLEVKPVQTAPKIPPQPALKATGAGDAIVSPLPGVILDIKVAVGDQVKIGQTVMILEAMKMENEIKANIEGTVKEILVKKGDSVLEGAALVKIGG
jgi:biotin carboxyl carrier protein